MNEQELYDYILDNLDYRLEKVEGDQGIKWCLPIGDYSGRDFYRNIPIEYITDEQIENLCFEVFNDAEVDFGEDEIDYDFFEEVFENVFYNLVDENTSK